MAGKGDKIRKTSDPKKYAEGWERIFMKCEQTTSRGGEGLDAWIQNACSCGWQGRRHYAYCSYQYSNAREEWERHVNGCEGWAG